MYELRFVFCDRLLICPSIHALDVVMLVQTDGQGYFDQIYSVSGHCKTEIYHLNNLYYFVHSTMSLYISKV